MIKQIQQNFGFNNVEVKMLGGYDCSNHLVKTGDKKYICKTYPNNTELFDTISAENDALIFLSKSTEGIYPEPIQNLHGSYLYETKINGVIKIIRMLSFLDGEIFNQVKHTQILFESFGAFLAQMDLELQRYNNYIIKAKKSEWDIQYFYLNKKYIHDIPNSSDRKIVEYFFQQFEENVLPIMQNFRKSIIHNDANDWNVLVNNNKVSGIIDFGDITYSLLINELAVAIPYAIFGKENPIDWAAIILKAYHEMFPLRADEVDVLYYLIAARLCISVCNSAHNKKINPSNSHIFIHEKSAWELLYQWITINPIFAKNTFRSSLGMKVDHPKPIDQAVKERHRVMSPILSLSYSKPIYMNRAVFQYMYDVYGNVYLDAYNNIPHVGHSHPKVVEAGQKQMAKLNTNTRYVYDNLYLYAERLLSKFPSSLNKIYFVNSGSAASDLAIRLATFHTTNRNIMVMEHGYHGHTQSCIDISDYKFSNKKGQGTKEHILKAPIPDTFRCKYKNDNDCTGELYAQEAIDLMNSKNEPIAAFISEPILGCAGLVLLAQGYLKKLYPAVRKQGGVCISDEIQTGFGRLGEFFWGFEAHDVIPDIVILGKPMGNGHPMGAVITTEEIANSFNKGVEFFSSFGGNPVSCTIGLAVLDVIEEEELQENAKEVGFYYKSILDDLKKEFHCIGDVRGSGLFIGVEIIKNPDTIEPNTHLANILKNDLRNKNILISTDGPNDSVLKSKPPLCFTKKNAEQVVSSLYDTLKQISVENKLGQSI
ncbi:MAG: aminotransferase class III-fold pyridoxal phosphate-dependent enzyme [Candidatus Marinimicrobia bacterium]|nr:aminotransferase class III-fold pyridoxal phosphate-dependent enzyme [Candidatus Neomarinimicrobiota bacterium]